jgi:hypothetical protein
MPKGDFFFTEHHDFMVMHRASNLANMTQSRALPSNGSLWDPTKMKLFRKNFIYYISSFIIFTIIPISFKKIESSLCIYL